MKMFDLEDAGCTHRVPFNCTPVGVNSTSLRPPHVLRAHMGGASFVRGGTRPPHVIETHTHPKRITGLLCG